METMEKAALHGLFVPSIRLLLLTVVVHLSAVFNPIMDSVVWVFIGQTYCSGGPLGLTTSSPHIADWDIVPPIFHGLTSHLALIYDPVLIFSILCTAFDRSNNLRICTLAGVSTFALYSIEEICWAWPHLLQGATLFVIEVAVTYVLLLRPYLTRSTVPYQQG